MIGSPAAECQYLVTGFVTMWFHLCKTCNWSGVLQIRAGKRRLRARLAAGKRSKAETPVTPLCVQSRPREEVGECNETPCGAPDQLRMSDAAATGGDILKIGVDKFTFGRGEVKA